MSLSILVTCLLDNVWIIKGRSYMLITSVSQRVEDFVGKCSFCVVPSISFTKGCGYICQWPSLCALKFFFLYSKLFQITINWSVLSDRWFRQHSKILGSERRPTTSAARFHITDLLIRVLSFWWLAGCRVSNDQFLEFPYNIQYASISSGLWNNVN